MTFVMIRTIKVLNRMVEDRVIENYVISGAIAAFYYSEPAATKDLDILITFQSRGPSKLVTLGPIVPYLEKLGYTEWIDEGLLVEGWPVQFLPVSDALDVEALQEAVEVELENPFDAQDKVKTRILKAEHVAAIALRTGRTKDYFRVHTLIESDALNVRTLKEMLAKHGLEDRWNTFCLRTGYEDQEVIRKAP